MQSKLKITSKGQITLKRDLLKELGVKPGDTVAVSIDKPGELRITPEPKGDIRAFFGCLTNDHDVHLTIDDINEAIVDGWAGKR